MGVNWQLDMELGQNELCKHESRIYPEFCSFLSFSILSSFFAQFFPPAQWRRGPICPVGFPLYMCVCVCVLFAGHWPNGGNNFYAVALVKLAWQRPTRTSRGPLGRGGYGCRIWMEDGGCWLADAGCWMRVAVACGPFGEQSKVHLKADLIT